MAGWNKGGGVMATGAGAGVALGSGTWRCLAAKASALNTVVGDGMSGGIFRLEHVAALGASEPFGPRPLEARFVILEAGGARRTDNDHGFLKSLCPV